MIFFEDTYTLQRVVVPPAIVRDCSEMFDIDPRTDDDTDQLRMLDCYWHRMGYYD